MIHWAPLLALTVPHYPTAGRGRLGEDTVPDESAILRFRHLLEQPALTSQIFDTVRALPEDHALLLKAGTIVVATIFAAPSSTKNATKTRDPAMRQTRTGNPWYFGMTVHVGTDTRGLVHSLTTTDAGTADITQLDDLLRGHETTLYGDKAYCKESDRQQWTADDGRYRINRRGTRTPLPGWHQSDALKSPCALRARVPCGDDALGL